MRLGLESFVDRSRHSSLVPSTCTCTYIFYIEHVVDVNATQVVFLAPKLKKKWEGEEKIVHKTPLQL